METTPAIFVDLTYIFVAALAGGLIAWRLRLPLIVGFVLGGIGVSPFTPGPQLSHLHSFDVLAETGVALLMFSTGVHFSVSALTRVKWVALAGTPIGIALITAITIPLSKLIGMSVAEGLVIGATISVASTMVLARLLNDSGKMSTLMGQVMIGMSLVEDVAVICMTVALPVFAGPAEGRMAKVAWAIGKAFALLVPMVLIAIKVIPPLLRRVKATSNPELFLLVTICVCLGTAAAAQAFGLSIALGAFVAGLALSESTDLHEAERQLSPLRDASVALFFVSLGALMDPKIVLNNLPLLCLLLVLVLIGKLIVGTAVVRMFGYPTRTAIAAGSGLAQIGELSFVVVQVAHAAGLVGDNVFSTTIAASLISISMNVFLVRYVFARIEPRGIAVATNA
jgi:CPA2 family monovalent cation:H+ antiporter-2